MRPAYLGVGYIIGPRLASLNFAGGVLAWGLLVPLLTFVMGPAIQAAQPAGHPLDWALLAQAIYISVVRPIAVGGMLVGATYTLFKMRKQLFAGIARAISDLKKSAAAQAASNRTERDLNAKVVFGGVAAVLFDGRTYRPAQGDLSVAVADPSRSLTSRDLQRMLDRARELAHSGAREQARELGVVGVVHREREVAACFLEGDRLRFARFFFGDEAERIAVDTLHGEVGIGEAVLLREDVHHVFFFVHAFFGEPLVGCRGVKR